MKHKSARRFRPLLRIFLGTCVHVYVYRTRSRTARYMYVCVHVLVPGTRTRTCTGTVFYSAIKLLLAQQNLQELVLYFIQTKGRSHNCPNATSVECMVDWRWSPPESGKGSTSRLVVIPSVLAGTLVLVSSITSKQHKDEKPPSCGPRENPPVDSDISVDPRRASPRARRAVGRAVGIIRIMLECMARIMGTAVVAQQ